MKKLLAALSLALLPLAASGQLVPLTDYYQVFNYGITLGTNAWTNAPGTLRRDPDGFRPQASDGTNWFAVGDLSDAPSNTNTYGRRGGSWVPVPTNQASGSGSGFPLTNDASAAGFDLTGGGTFQATNGEFSALSVSGLAGLGSVSAGSAAFGDTTINGDLVVTGVTYEINHVVVNTSTTIVGGVVTQFITETVYTTNVQYMTTVIQTSTYVHATNEVTYWTQAGGTWDLTNAASVLLPFMSWTNGGAAEASGPWDFSGASVSNLPEDANHGSPLASIADGTVSISATSQAWRVAADGATVATNWAIAGTDANEMQVFLIDLALSSNTFAWPAPITNASTSTTNVFFLYRRPGGAWALE